MAHLDWWGPYLGYGLSSLTLCALPRTLLVICCQPALQHGSREVFVLVGATGFEPVASAV